eukprot:CAMPEP_0183358690 /NCGR_PEP_ID=MMETSP0164_2-20130417/49971_1 /TAXON_ID=221442 /ORGANISM="Coccolithus pelagicus ssp braarudi, Strain PLY182g" /LENGTH=255 /DNA_ID=CAMNT_0025532631 /DNA_START=63 /DNA_END=831 /DNA_ORIENTATION=-
MEEEVDELVAELEASMDHDDLQVPMEHLDEPNNSGATASAGGNSASTFISLLPPELLAKVLQFVPHPVLLTTLRLVGKHISDAAEAEAATRTQLKLQESLTAGFSADARLLPADIVALTWRVQHALHHPSHRRHFRSKYRAILFNLKDPKNPDLRHRLALGELQPEELLHLRTRELAGDALQQQRSAWRQKERESKLALTGTVVASLPTCSGASGVGAMSAKCIEQFEPGGWQLIVRALMQLALTAKRGGRSRIA